MTIRENRETWNEYMRVYHLKRYHRLKNEAFKFLGGKCVKCGKTEKLQFDHIDPKEKNIEMGKFLTFPLKKFWEEVKKCQLLCDECHQLKTINDLGKKVAKGTHGTISSYRYCHCEICKEAKREWTRNYRKTSPRS